MFNKYKYKINEIVIFYLFTSDCSQSHLSGEQDCFVRNKVQFEASYMTTRSIKQKKALTLTWTGLAGLSCLDSSQYAVRL